MARKPTYEELEERIRELEEESDKGRRELDALRESGERHRVLLDESTDPIFFFTSEGRYVYVNKAFADGVGRPLDKIIDKKIWDVFPKDEADRRFAALSEVFRTGEEKVIEVRVPRPDGDRFYITTIAPIKDTQGRVHTAICSSKNITERKKVEEALRGSEERYRTLVEESFDGIFIQKGPQIIFANQRLNQMLGYRDGGLEGQDHWIVYHPDYQPITRERAQARMRGEEAPSQYEVKLQRKDGTSFDGEIRARAIQFGNEPGIQVWIRDITERKLSEEALRESEKRYRDLYDQAPMGYIEVDSEGRICRVNRRELEILGYEAEEMLGQHPWDFVVENVGPGIIMAKLAGLLPPSKGLERKYRRKDGTTLPVLIADTIVRDHEGRITGIRSTIEDVTEHKRMEESLRESEALFRNLFEHHAAVKLIIDPDTGDIVDANAAAAEFYGWTREQLKQMKIQDINTLSPQEIKQEIEKAMAHERIHFEFRHRRADGSIRDVDVFSSKIEAKGKDLLHSIVHDITERKRAEEERERLQTQLHQAQKMEAIGTLAGGIAHDFNNILMGIQGRASLMLTDTGSSNPHFEHLRGIEEYVRSAADLTKQLLGFARGGKYEVKVTDLNQLTDRSASLFGRTKKEIVIHRKFQQDLWTVEVDRRQMEQVLLNLFVNAWQAMPAGGEIYLQTQNVVLDDVYVKAHGVKPGKYVKISVTDTGVGMDEQTKQRMFDPFFTTKRMGRGTGLGLASAYGIIKNHDGIITAYSEKGHGSTFNLYLPASGKGVSEEKAPPGDLVKGEGTILLVDDEELILEVGNPLLERLGYKVLVARSGKEAIEIYQSHMGLIRGVILDMIMPQMSGGETFDRLKAINPQVKVLLSSGYSITGQAQEILNRGCQGFIQKPFNLRELSQRLGEILGKP